MDMWTAPSDYDLDVARGNEDRWGHPGTPTEQEATALDQSIQADAVFLAEFDLWYDETHPALTDEDFERMERAYRGNDL